MGLRQRLDDAAGMAGGAFSLMSGLKAEGQALAKSRADAFAQRMELVRREEFDAALELARRAVERAEALEARVAALEARLGASAG
jgi:BMFP domain-containing protein YqiC